MVAGGAIIELVWMSAMDNQATFDGYLDAIRRHGAAGFLLSSDLGQAGNPLHPDGLIAFMAALSAAGISDEDIDLMIRRNPASLLGGE